MLKLMVKAVDNRLDFTVYWISNNMKFLTEI
jgi:hypothetical protein